MLRVSRMTVVKWLGCLNRCMSCLATPFKTFLKKVRSGDSGTHKYFCITKDQVTTMVVFLIPEDEERWGQDLHRTTDASVCVVTKDKKQKVMGWKDSRWVQVLTDWCLFQPFDLHRCEEWVTGDRKPTWPQWGFTNQLSETCGSTSNKTHFIWIGEMCLLLGFNKKHCISYWSYWCLKGHL